MIYVNVYISTNPEFAIYDICTNSEFASRIGRLGFFCLFGQGQSHSQGLTAFW